MKYFAAGKTPAIILIFFLLFSLTLFIPGCASVPKEAVELSYTIGTDLEALHQSYKALISQYFESLRKDINSSIDRVFIPAYIADYIKEGELVESAKSEKYDLVEIWARAAVDNIEKERISRIEPINKSESELVLSVNEAFDRVVRANATITAHLNSIRKVEEIQNDLQDALSLKGIRDRINDALAAASVKTKEINVDIDKTADELRKKISLFKK